MANIIACIYCTVILLHVLRQCCHANPPIIHYSHNMRILKIPYSTEPGSIVYRIKATDADNDDIFFDVLEDFGKEILRLDKINHNEANVVLLESLKENDEYNLTIYATDNKESTYVESRVIATSIEALPAQQLSYIILEHNPVYVYENETLNKSITIVRAHDRQDSKLPVTFELLENTDVFDFRYIFGPRGMSTAEIVLISELDYERQNLYVLTLLAINGQSNIDVDTRNVHSVQLSVVVKDVQDTPPVFFNLPEIIVLNNFFKLNESIFRVVAEDGDQTTKRNLTYAIEDQSKQHFQINLNGNVFAKLPYENLREMYHSLPFELTVRASEIVSTAESDLLDPESVSSTSQLMILLANDNQKPQFEAEFLVGHIKEHSSHMTAVIWEPNSESKANVVDLDLGLNASMEFNVIDLNRTFTIEPKTAYQRAFFHLMVNDSSLLDYENTTNLTVIITVKDNSEEWPLSSSINCTIYIEDINDNYPQFTQSVYKSVIFENVQEGTVIAKVTATDKDSGQYGQVRYTTIKGPFAHNLHLDSNEGTVTLVNNKDIDRETVEQYVVIIEARDDLGKGNINTTELHIQVLDVNDNAPVFLQANYIAVVNTDFTGFLHPLQLTAIDIDEINTPNSMVKYEILHGNYEDAFLIDPLSGTLSVNERNKANQIKLKQNWIALTVRAYDLGIPQLSSTADVLIYVQYPTNIVQTTFLTKKKLKQKQEPLEKNLNNITGGNVHVMELRPPDDIYQPTEIVTWIQYPNETMVDLDSILVAYNHMVYEPLLQNDLPLSSITKNVTVLKSTPGTSRNIKTSSISKLDILIWIMVFLILLLLLFLIYLIYLICKRKGKSQLDIKQDNLSKSEVEKTIVTKTTSQRNRRHRLNKRNRNNRIMAITNNNFKDEAKFVRKQNLQENNDLMTTPKATNVNTDSHIQYEIEKTKKYLTTPDTVTYYEFKRLQYPKQNNLKTINVLSLDHSDSEQLTPEKFGFPTLTGEKILQEPGFVDHHENHQQQEHQQKNKKPETQHLSFQDENSNDLDRQEGDSNLTIIKNSNHDNSKFSSQITNLTDHMQANQLAEQSIPNYLNNTTYSPMIGGQKMYKKSIFSITYDRVHNRENISSESDKTL